MKEGDVREIVAAAVRQERRVWSTCLLLVVATIGTLHSSPIYSHNPAAVHNFDATLKTSSRRMLLQNIQVPGNDTVGTPDDLSSSSTLNEINAQLQLLSDALANFQDNNRTLEFEAPAIEETFPGPVAEPAVELAESIPSLGNVTTTAPVAEPAAGIAESISSLGNATTTAEPVTCNCPPGPKGDSAPAFLSQIFSYNAAQNVLNINATTITMGGSLVVDGYTGVKQSLFVGGDPASGAASTEVGPGKVLMYAKDGGPTIAGLTTSEEGFQVSNVTVIAKLFEDDGGQEYARRVSTRLFN